MASEQITPGFRACTPQAGMLSHDEFSARMQEATVHEVQRLFETPEFKSWGSKKAGGVTKKTPMVQIILMFYAIFVTAMLLAQTGAGQRAMASVIGRDAAGFVMIAEDQVALSALTEANVRIKELEKTLKEKEGTIHQKESALEKEVEHEHSLEASLDKAKRDNEAMSKIMKALEVDRADLAKQLKAERIASHKPTARGAKKDSIAPLELTELWVTLMSGTYVLLVFLQQTWTADQQQVLLDKLSDEKKQLIGQLGKGVTANGGDSTPASAAPQATPFPIHRLESATISPAPAPAPAPAAAPASTTPQTAPKERAKSPFWTHTPTPTNPPATPKSSARKPAGKK